MKDAQLNLKAVIPAISKRIKNLQPYSFVIFLVFVGLIYGAVLFKINTLRNVEPSANDVSGQVKAAQIPHVDPAVVSQLESLQDNSVSVKSLFDQARSNPFQ